MEGLEYNGILGESEVNALFDDTPEIDTSKQQEEPQPAENNNKEDTTETDNKEETTEIPNVEDLFSEESGSVGSDDNSEGKEDTNTEKKGSSPNTYSSIAKAFAEDGIFPDLSEDDINNVTGPEAFLDLFNKLVESKVDERNKRADKALGYGVEPTDVQKYEQTLRYLESLDDDALSAEDDKGDNLRKQLLYQDFINRGYSKDRAIKMTERSFNAGTDIEDAKEALQSNKDFFKESYDALMEKSKQSQEQAVQERKASAEKLKKSILEDKSFFGDLDVDKATRQKAFDNISKPIWKDPETGDYYTALQKYEYDNHADFIKNVGLLFTLTDGFKSLDKVVKGRVKKEVNKGIRSLERTLNNTSRSPDGNLRFVTSVNEDPESFIGKGIKLNL